MKCFQIRNGMEWGFFFLLEGRTDSRFWCVLSIVSSFGNYGVTWTHMGRPASAFLAGLDRGYAASKLAGPDAFVFDGDAANRAMREWVLQRRRTGSLSRDEARELFQLLGEVDFTSEATWYASTPSALIEVAQDVSGRQCERLNPQFAGLWEHLWPAFLTELSAPSQVAA